MTHKLTLLIALPVVAGMVAACGGGGGRSHAPQPAKLAAAPAPAPIYVPARQTGGDVAGAILSSTSTSAGPLFDSEYGLYVLEDDKSITLGSYAQGNLTPLSQMPRNVTASYRGSFVGFGDATGPGSEVLEGDVRLRADFGAGTVNGQVNNLQNQDGASKSYGLSMNGRISGNEYSGKAGYTTAGGAPSGTVTSSGLSGAFLGPNAAETAGTLDVTGRPGRGQPSITTIGSFGAKKQ